MKFEWNTEPVTPMIEIDRYPNLRLLTWQMHQDAIREDEAFSIYERVATRRCRAFGAR